MNGLDVSKLVKKNRVLVLIGSILGLILGILCVITPFWSGAILVWVLIGLIGVFGLGSIVRFIFPGKGNKRSGWMLASGIILVLCVTAIILAGIFAKEVVFQGETYSGLEATTIRLLGFGSIFFGVLSIFSNIFLLCNVGRVEEGKGWAIAKGVIGIVVGVLMTVFPFVMYFISVIVGGVYLVFMSICLIIMDCKLWKLGDKPKEEKKVVAEQPEEVKEEK